MKKTLYLYLWCFAGVLSAVGIYWAFSFAYLNGYFVLAAVIGSAVVASILLSFLKGMDA